MEMAAPGSTGLSWCTNLEHLLGASCPGLQALCGLPLEHTEGCCKSGRGLFCRVEGSGVQIREGPCWAGGSFLDVRGSGVQMLGPCLSGRDTLSPCFLPMPRCVGPLLLPSPTPRVMGGAPGPPPRPGAPQNQGPRGCPAQGRCSLRAEKGFPLHVGHRSTKWAL